MSSEKFKRKFQAIWISFRPFLIFLLVIAILFAIPLLIIALVLLFDDNNVTFLILVIIDFSVLGIFAIGFLAFGFQYVISLLIEKEEVKCINCGKTISSKAKICSVCGVEQ
ncbi:MAG: hypothetical protein GPJ51_10070 [Candidatus Heimdallarchaeota archaeon]|nr:hypothetical protein [Candidatus Heimdallarchaeota archaeon]